MPRGILDWLSLSTEPPPTACIQADLLGSCPHMEYPIEDHKTPVSPGSGVRNPPALLCLVHARLEVASLQVVLRNMIPTPLSHPQRLQCLSLWFSPIRQWRHPTTTGIKGQKTHHRRAACVLKCSGTPVHPARGALVHTAVSPAAGEHGVRGWPHRRHSLSPTLHLGTPGRDEGKKARPVHLST